MTIIINIGSIGTYFRGKLLSIRNVLNDWHWYNPVLLLYNYIVEIYDLLITDRDRTNKLYSCY